MSNTILTNTEKLFSFLARNKWQNVTPSFATYVKREVDELLTFLRQQGIDVECPKLIRLVEDAETGKFMDAKTILVEATHEYEHMIENKKQLHKPRGIWNRPVTQPTPHDSGAPDNLPVNSNDGNRGSDHGTPQGPENGPHDNSLSLRSGDVPGTNRNRQEHDISPRQNPPTQRNHQGYDNPTSNRDQYRLGTPPTHRDQQYRQKTPPPYRESDLEREPARREPARAPGSPEKRDTFRPARQDITPRQDNYRPPRQGNSPVRRPLDEPTQGGRDAYRPGGYDDYRYREPEMTYPHRQAFEPINQNLGAEHEIWKRDFQNDNERQRAHRSSYKDDYPPRDLETQDAPANYGRKVHPELYRMPDLARRPNEHDIIESDPITHRNAEQPERINSVRPRDLVRLYEDVYEVEWNAAFNEMSPKVGNEQTIRHMLWIITESDGICMDIAKKQMQDLEKTAFVVMANPDINRYGTTQSPRNTGSTEPRALDSLSKYRKQSAPLSLPYIKSECVVRIKRTLLDSSTLPEAYLHEHSKLSKYIQRCAELSWLMCVQEPPVVMDWITKDQEGLPFNYDHYRPFSERKGDKYDYCVWPMLREGRDGPVLARGYANRI